MGFAILVLICLIALAVMLFKKSPVDAIIASRPNTVKTRYTTEISIPNADGNDTLALDVGSNDIRHPVHNLLLMEYVDANGKRSRRRVTVHSFSPMGGNDGYLNAFCHERDQRRSFYLSRVQSLVDMKTGEIITDAVSFFAELLKPANESPIMAAMRNHEAAILILVFVSRADDRMTHHERKVIAAYIQGQLETPLDPIELDNKIKRLHCDPAEFRRAITVIAEFDTQKKDALLKAIRQLIAADGLVDSSEEAVVRKLVTAIN